MKKKKDYKYIYGPVPSWRLGRSLGIDPISAERKVCSFDCVYCQLGDTLAHSKKRKVFVPAEAVVEELKSLPKGLKIDYITFSGAGEPTLAKNLGKMIRAVKKIRKEPVAVLTNASLLHDPQVRKDLSAADLVVAKLDASSEEVLRRVNRPMKGIGFPRVIEGIKKFSKNYGVKLALQIMFIKENEKYAKEIARLARGIGADEIQLNTPLRPCGVKPLSKNRMKQIKKHFKGLNILSVYDSPRKKTRPVSAKATLRRRGKI